MVELAAYRLAVMPAPRACLVDVYDTVLSCDFTAHRAELPAIAGVDVEAWAQTLSELAPAVSEGRIPIAAAFTEILRRSGGEYHDALVHDLVQRDQELLLSSTKVHDDTISFLDAIRTRGVMTALVSNCFENTRALLDAVGLTDLVDAVVLSCDVGATKPSAAIYEHALRELKVLPAKAIFIDDQAAYCAGAERLGITAYQIARDPNTTSDRHNRTIGSLYEITSLF